MKNILYTIILCFLFSSNVFAEWNSKNLKEVHDGCTSTDESDYDTFGGKNKLILYCDCSTYNLSQDGYPEYIWGLDPMYPGLIISGLLFLKFKK